MNFLPIAAQMSRNRTVCIYALQVDMFSPIAALLHCLSRR
jgi:hypothetical protein